MVEITLLCLCLVVFIFAGICDWKARKIRDAEWLERPRKGDIFTGKHPKYGEITVWVENSYRMQMQDHKRWVIFSWTNDQNFCGADYMDFDEFNKVFRKDRKESL